ncbi:glycosyltransferase family 2 protein [Streptomyces sp. H10-C2]|uniref:glycosyltransferase n=1 Tax=unclassified Streptomyces TaxID=2593676 RepID=UPI0024B88E6A|nr:MULTISPECIES: glycosyltransferase family 2 protein [unclassified Streptomyces]MDJ0341176.1 glycosyltransferase family 2 protein [Streptomyces sp. PH10-H1]MDJ0369471.1 glycosyltransferase family 2 protein [Streptomyces sp. H10-C2]
MNRLDATAIVVTYNSTTHISSCLGALIDAGLAVRVVDNASSDGTAAFVAARFPEVPVISNSANVGYAAAINQALAATDTDIVLLVNPDCMVPAATARGLVHTIRSGPQVGVAGPRLVDPDGNIAISAHPFESWITVLASRFGGGLLPVPLRRLFCGTRRRSTYDACRQPGLPIAVDWLSGACMAVRTALLRQIGGLDEGYFMYYEDEELCLQVWRQGAQVLYVPAVKAIHVGGASCDDPSWIWPHLYRSLLRFFARHRPRSYPVVRATILLRAVLGVALAVARQPRAGVRANPRVRAWAQVVQIARTATPIARTTAPTLTGVPTCTS